MTSECHVAIPQFHGIKYSPFLMRRKRLIQCHLYINEQTSDPAPWLPLLVLTAKFLTPPGIHSDPFSLADGSVCGQYITQWLSLARHAAAIIDAFYEGAVEGGHFPTFPELTVPVMEDLALLSVLSHYLAVHIRTQKLFVCSAARLHCHQPLLPEVSRVKGFPFTLQTQVITRVPVEVPTEATHSFSIVARHLGSHMGVPVETNGQAEVCAQDSIFALAERHDFSTCGLEGQVVNDAVHLGRDTGGPSGQGTCFAHFHSADSTLNLSL